MAIDLKYGRVTTEHGDLGEDEPVVVFRAQDRLLPAVLEVYWLMCENAGSPDRHLEQINAAKQAVKDWQTTHHTQTPQSKEH
jgi:hypothetical protein